MNNKLDRQSIFEIKQSVSEFILNNANVKIDEHLLTTELTVFADKLIEIFAGDDKLEYVEFMTNCVIDGIKLTNEADLLEYVVPIWASARGQQIPRDKLVDEFYYELEMLILFNLLMDMIDNNLDATGVAKLRAIIRRYSNLPEVWKFLCAASGDEVIDAYTF